MHFKQSLKNMEEEKMSNKVLIFGKDAWPYTRAAREAFAKEGRQVDYYDVKKDNEHFGTMLKHSKGERKVPVIVEGDAVTIGFDGGTWAVWIFRLEAGRLANGNSILDTCYWMLDTWCCMPEQNGVWFKV